MPDLCLVGLHCRADGRMEAADFEAIRLARIEAVKLMTTSAPEDVERCRAINPQMFLMCRLFIGGLDNRVVSAEQAARDWEWEARQFYNRGVRYFEVHNEPNLVIEGLGRNWNNGAVFGQLFAEVVGYLRRGFPEARFGFPGLSPGDTVPGVRQDSGRFWAEAEPYIYQQADWIGAHAYWINEASMRLPGAGGAWRGVRDRFPGKEILITEFANPNPHETMAQKGRQYAQYYADLRFEPRVTAAFAFVVSASNQAEFGPQVWRDEAGRLNEVVARVGTRVMPILPPVAPPPPVKEEPVSNKRKMKVARVVNVRRQGDRDTVTETIPAGTEIEVYESAGTVDGWENRVYLDPPRRHAWAANLAPVTTDPPSPPPGGDEAIFHWPTEHRVVTQRFGVNREFYAPYGLDGHEGIDLRAPEGSQIFAAYDGEVYEAQLRGAYGLQVRVRHRINGKTVHTIYAHNGELLVKVGDQVRRGQVIARADATGNVRPPGAHHLHFGVKVDGEGPPGYSGYQDPAPWLGLK